MREQGELIRAAVAGDRGAFDELVRLKREQVVRIAYQVTGDWDDALDVAQGVFLKLWKGLGRFDAERRFDTWPYRITMNAAIDWIRSQGAVKAHQQPLPEELALPVADSGPGPESRLDLVTLRDVFRDLAGRLAPKQRLAFVMREIEGSSLVQHFDEPDRNGEPSPAPNVNPCRIVVSDPGNLESIQLENFSPPEPGPGEVQIEIVAAGLNFRDVLAALGQMPDIENGLLALGGECSGVVRAVGEGVHHLSPGDAVVAVAPSTFGTHTTTSVHGVASMPENLDFEQAAGIPIVFLTVYYALKELANLQRQERILIHAAAGGVGLAAVQLAKKVGAEIFATAGHPEKREFLKSLGIEHVMDSRSLAFVEEIRERTAGEGVDVVLNSLAGEFIPASLGLLRSHGPSALLSLNDALELRRGPLARDALRDKIPLDAIGDLAALDGAPGVEESLDASDATHCEAVIAKEKMIPCA